MKLPTRVIREWKTVTSTDGQEIVWIGVLDNGEFALALELPGSTWQQGSPEDLEEVEIPLPDGSVRRVPTSPVEFGQQHQDEIPMAAFDLDDEHEASPEVGDAFFDEQGRDAQTRWLQEREQMRRTHDRRRQ